MKTAREGDTPSRLLFRFYGNKGIKFPKKLQLTGVHVCVESNRSPAWRSTVDMFDWTVMRAARLQDTLERLTAAIRDVESELAAMKAEHDELASHIFVSRRSYRNVTDTKSGKRREMTARLSFNTACELGFRGSLDEWERLMGAVARR
jgi:hypothetical protein